MASGLDYTLEELLAAVRQYGSVEIATQKLGLGETVIYNRFSKLPKNDPAKVAYKKVVKENKSRRKAAQVQADIARKKEHEQRLAAKKASEALGASKKVLNSQRSYTSEEVLDAIRECGSVRAAAARHLGISAQLISKHFTEMPNDHPLRMEYEQLKSHRGRKKIWDDPRERDRFYVRQSRLRKQMNEKSEV